MPAQRSLSRQWDRTFHGVMIRLQRRPLFRRLATRLHLPYSVDKATPADMRAVAAWYGAPEMETQVVPPQTATNYAARSMGRVIGFAQLVHLDASAGPQTGYWLYSLRVRIGWRGVGVGEALTRRVLADAQRLAAPRISLVVYADNQPAIALYRKLGFERVQSPAIDETLARDAGPRRRVVMSRVL